MELLKSEVFRCLVLLLQALTMVALAYLGNLTLQLRKNSEHNKPKIEETRENVSRLINGKGVAHDHERAVEAARSPTQSEDSAPTKDINPCET